MDSECRNIEVVSMLWLICASLIYIKVNSQFKTQWTAVSQTVSKYASQQEIKKDKLSHKTHNPYMTGTFSYLRFFYSYKVRHSDHKETVIRPLYK